MGKIICFIYDQMADFEITLAFHKIKQVGKKEVVPVSYDLNPVESESGIWYAPQATLAQAMAWTDMEALLIPGGPIGTQRPELTAFIQKFDREQRIIAAICNGPQFLGRAGVLDNRLFTTSCAVERIVQLGVADPFPRHNYVEQRVVRDGHILTAKGRAFVDFTQAVLEALHIYEGQEHELEKLIADIRG
ncbi:DJ-1/PfpI family protein [Paenibacillus sp. y28]|uniref:DJ-1/PfpI family protein n=1 Tax=Paenibacillus sp. y28 TaxID=3129110 RepID=UPI00301A0B85